MTTAAGQIPAKTIKWSAFQELDMEMTTRDLETQAQEIAGKSDHTLAEDLVNEVWAWMAQNPLRCSRWWYENAANERRFSRRNFLRDVREVMIRQCRLDRLAAQGLEDEDQVTYSAKQLRRYLPYVWHSEVLAAVGEVNEISAKGDPAKGGDAMVSAMDVRRAYAAVITEGSRDDKILFCLYALGFTQGETGDQVDLTQQGVSKIERQLLERMAAYLAGPELRPHRTLGDGPGTRPKPPKGLPE